MKFRLLFFLIPLCFSFAIFAGTVNDNFGKAQIAPFKNFSVQIDDSFSYADDDAVTGPESAQSAPGRVFGIIFLFSISFVSAVVFFILCLIIFFKRKKLASLPKFLLSGCSVILFLVFILSLIGASLALYYFLKERRASAEKNSKENIEYSFEMPDGSGANIPNTNQEPDEEIIIKSAFEKFNNTVKLYKEYQETHDPEIYKKAIQEIELAIEGDSENPAYWLLAGKIYSEIAPDYDVQVLAEIYLRKSLELDPKNLQTILTLANCLSLQERYYEAGELFTKALSRDYYALRDYLVPIITYTYIYDQQYEKAEKFLRKLLENDPGADVLRISLAIALNMQGKERANDAKNELRKIIAKSDSPQILKTYATNLLNNFDKWHNRSFEE